MSVNFPVRAASFPASARLCKTCRAVFVQSVHQSVPFPGKYLRDRREGDSMLRAPAPHQKSITALQQSALHGCYFCSALACKISEASLAGVKSSGFATSYFLWHDVMEDWDENESGKPIHHFLRLTFVFGAEAEVTSEDSALEYILYRTSELEFYQNKSIFTESTNSIATWDVAQNWFKNCVNNHAACRRGVGQGQPRKLPTRLLKLSDNSHSKIYLEDAVKLDAQTHYATLSHRWGSSKVVVLSKDSEARLRNGIEASELSQTFREAIAVSRRLGLYYLWIDSMCIFQDSRADWEKESAMMGDVYRHSACNIAATGSLDGDGGLFHPRDPSDILPLCVETTWSRDTSRVEHASEIVELNDNYTIFEKHFWNKELSEAPLLSRGWVVQERILSPRVLHFGERQILWECLELDASEVYPRGRPDQDLARHNLSSSSTYKPLKPLTDSNSITDEDPEHIAMANFPMWKKVIYLSSSTDLTKASDKLASLSGIAKSMRVPSDDQYLAGLWKSWIYGFLFWRVPDGRRANGERSRRVEPYVAPTWSWASLDAVIWYDLYSLYAIFIKVLETHIELATSDPTGQVIGGFLRLSGPLFSLVIPDPVRVSSEIDGVDVKTIREFDASYLWGYYDQEEGQPVLLNGNAMKASLKPDIPFSNQRDDLFFLATEFGWSFRMEGMILTSSGKEDGSFVRIGYLAINAVDSKERWTYEYEDAWPKLEPLVREIILI